MDEAAAIAALQARGRFGIRLGLGRTRALLRALGSPERQLRGVLIGGTNGKGSVQAMVASVLRVQGLRVGQTPKPHLVSYRERIAVDGRPIASEAFGPLLAEVLAAADRVERRHGPPTEFEALTCAAFLWFARSGVEVAVIEVGLGGRLDATHAWDGGVATVTNVALDHMEYLGDTVPAIAREKAAIIERGDLAVTGAQGDALGVIRRRARRLGVPLTVSDSLEVRATRRWGMTLGHPMLGDLDVGLVGDHQASNAGVAIETLAALARAGITEDDPGALRAGLAEVRWPGRLELLTTDGPIDGGRATGSTPIRATGMVDVVLDGAHNPDGAAALARSLERMRDHLAPGRVTLLLGVMHDKDVAGLVRALRSSVAIADAQVITTSVPDAPRILDPVDLADMWGVHARPVTDTDDALAAGLDAAAASDGPLIVAGSLYLVGHVRGRLTGGRPA